MTDRIGRTWDLLCAVVRRFHDDRCMQIAASLAFTTLLSIVPLVTVTLALLSLFPAFEILAGALETYVLENLVPESADAVALYMEQFTANAARLTVLGVVILAFTAVALLMTIDSAFNGIWRVRRKRPLLQRVLVYLVLLALGPALVGTSLSITSWLVTHSLQLVGDVPGVSIALLKATPMLLTSAALGLLYLTMPNRRIGKRNALYGGLLAGTVFELLKAGFAFYIATFPAYQLVYGTFAAVPVFLVWVYLSWLVVLLGAVFVAALPEWREGASDRRNGPGSDFYCALHVLKLLRNAREEGVSVTLDDIHRAVRARMERVEMLLESMTGAGWIARGRRGWTLARPAGDITVADVYRRFVFAHGDRPYSRRTAPEFEALGAAVSERVAENLRMSLDDLFREGAGDGLPGGGACAARNATS